MKAGEYLQTLQKELVVGENVVDIPAGLGKIYLPDGSVLESGVTKTKVIIRNDGSLKTFYPFDPTLPH